MGKRPFIVLLVFCLLWLAACGADAPEVLPTATAVPPQPTATATQPPTALPSPTMGVVETAVVTPASSATPTFTPKAIDPSTPSPFPPFQAGDNFQLRIPDSELIAQILSETLAQQQAFKALSDSSKSAVLEAEFASLFSLIDRDITHYYPHGFADSETVVKEPHESDYLSFGSIRAIWQAYVLQALNDNKIILSDQTTIEIPYAHLTPWEIERKLGGDPAWLLFVVPDFQGNKPLFLPGLLPVVRQSNMEYALFPNNFSRAYFPEYTNILTDYDLTGDGQQDIIIDIGSEAGGVMAHRLEVYSWEASSIVQLANIYADNGKYTDSPRVEIGDYNEDGFSDIRITHQKWMDLGCQYEEVELYSWRGTEPQYTQTSNLADKPECDAARAITQNLSSQSIYIGDVILSPENLSVDERITMLDRSLANTTIETAPFVDYIALLRLHLAMAYQSKGENELALATMASIHDLPQTEFSTAIQNIFLATDEDLVASCRLMYQDEWFRSLDMNANDDLLAQLGMLRNYGYPTTALQRRMCPFPMVIAGLLERLSLPVSLSPEAAFAANHIEILFQHEFNIDDDLENEWLVIVEPAAPQVVILDAVDDTWQLYRLAELIPPVTDIQVQAITDTLDGSPLLLLQATQNIYSWFCWGDQQTDILTIGLSEGVHGLVDHTIACADESLPLRSDSLDNSFFESPVDFFYNQQINQIEEMILAGERPFPDLQNELNDLIDKLPNDTPSHQMMHNRLLYLSGLTYELAGDNNQAVTTYLSLIRQAPNSPWSWLAWARLEPAAQ